MPPPVATRPAIRVGGQSSAALTENLLELTVVEDVNGASRCDAVFDNWNATGSSPSFRLFGRDVLDFGKSFVVGWGTGAVTVFDGRVMAIGGGFPEAAPPTVRVSAEDRLADLRMTQRTRTFADVSDADVVQRVASDHGMTADVNLSGSQHRLLAQVNQSDLAFLHERARANGAEIRIDGTQLMMRTRPAGAATTVVEWRRNLRSFAVIADLSDQRTRVRVSGWDVAAKAKVEQVADSGAISGELGGREDGPAILSASIGSREDVVATAVPWNDAEARDEAVARFRARARRFVTGRGVADANPIIRAGSLINLLGLGPLFSGAYYVTEARHLFDGAQGARTEFTAESVGIGRP